MKPKLDVWTVLLSGLLIFSGSAVASATPFDQGSGQIYDNGLNGAWLQNANLPKSHLFGVSRIDGLGRMSWFTSNTWIAAMNTANYKGSNDWRLPLMHPDCASPSYRDACRLREMEQLFKVERIHVAIGTVDPSDSTTNEVGVCCYRSGTEILTGGAGVNEIVAGSRHRLGKMNLKFVRAVYGAGTPYPSAPQSLLEPFSEPPVMLAMTLPTILLLSYGWVGLLAWWKRKKQTNHVLKSQPEISSQQGSATHIRLGPYLFPTQKSPKR